MQGLIIPPRDTFTEAQIRTLIQDSSALIVGAGCELLDLGLNLIQDITEDLVDGKVARSSYATLHGNASLEISRELPWGRAIVRPYMTLRDSSITARFNLGAYFTNTPSKTIGSTPQNYSVEGYDLLQALATTAGQAYAVDSGTSYLTAIETILQQQGFTKYILDPSRSSTTLPASKVWPLEDSITWLTIVNDLLSAIGYRGIWSDWNGYLRSEPYERPVDRQSEWTYTVDKWTSMLEPHRTFTRDFFNSPNRWVAVRNNNVSGSMPVEGDGIYTYVNQYSGETSVEARQRTITRVLRFDAADQDALVAQAEEAIDTDMRIKTTIDVSSSPNPLHWHFDKLTVNDPELGPATTVLESSWELPLRGGSMSHQWSVI